MNTGLKRSHRLGAVLLFEAISVFATHLLSAPVAEMVEAKTPAHWPTRAWRTSTPEEQGLDSVRLAAAFDFLKEKDPNIHSLLIIRNGFIVADAAFYPFQDNGLHDLASVTKSMTSTFVGIAIRKGLIKGLDQPMLDFFADRKIANLDDRKKAITLRDLLTMRSGLQCIVQPTEVTLFQMMNSPDWVQFMLDLPMTDRPGTKFIYNSGAVHLLSAILRKATGVTALDFARKELFGPLGITGVIWPMDPQGVSNDGWGDMRLRPRDMAKIGLLYLNNGVWDGKQILTPHWVETVTHKRPEVPETDYGYLWWIYKDAGYYARGRGGQHIIVLPAQNMVIVTTGGGFTNGGPLLETYILPAVHQGQGPLPPNPQGDALLVSKIGDAGRKPKATVNAPAEWPATADRVAGRTFVLEPNPWRISAMTLKFHGHKEGTLTVATSADTGQNPVYPIGFEGEYIIGPGRYGLPAAGKGRWESQDRLVIEIDEIGTINKFVFELNFSGDGVTGSALEKTGLGKIPIKGTIR